MKIFDINTSVGHWPFRKLKNDTPEKLRNELESHDISGASVANTNGLFYLNCHDANIELHEWLKGHEKFFTGIATINPFYAQWEKDLRNCVEKFNFGGVRIAPQYHNYELDSIPDSFAELAASLDIPVFIPHRLIDIRQRHWMDTEKAILIDTVYDFCMKYPAMKVIYTEAAVSADFFNGKKKCRNLFLEMSRMHSSYGQSLSILAKEIGADRLLFGSGSPFKEISSSLLKLEYAALKKDEKEKIASGNAIKLLR